MKKEITIVEKNISLEIYDTEKEIVFNIVFLDTGEIRQKRRTKEWLFERIFNSELKTWLKKWNEDLKIDDILFIDRDVCEKCKSTN